MIYSRLTRPITVLGFASLISGCAGLPPSVNLAPRTDDVRLPSTSSQFKSFHYTGKPQLFTVPSGVTQVTILADGAGGGSGTGYAPGGRGGHVHAVVPVQSNETLYVYVGGVTNSSGGGFDGGGNAEAWGYCGGAFGGGGATDVREGGQSLANRIVVAGGGGGAGGDLCSYTQGQGGPGGARTGGPGQNASGTGAGYGGTGGTQTRGGLGGNGGSGSSGNGQRGKPGRLGVGGAGGKTVCDGRCPAGGAGGGGYYGGGGGGGGGYSGGSGGGAGGGSSFVEPSAKGFRMYRGSKNNTGNGYLTIEWVQ
jgi:Glycine rich protein